MGDGTGRSMREGNTWCEEAEQAVRRKLGMTKEWTIEQAEAGLKIDKVELDEELINQPSVFCSVSMEYVSTVSERDYLKEEADRMERTVDLEVRAAAAQSGTKITEAAISSEVKLNEHVIEIRDRFFKSKEKADRWGVLREAFLQRAHVLKDLAHLATSEWSMTTSVSSGKGEPVSETVHQARTTEVKRRRIATKR